MIIGQLSQLIKCIQQHRGVSMALLSDDQEFVSTNTNLLTQIDKRLSMLFTLFDHSQWLTKSDKDNVQNAWDMLKTDWQGDSALDNFELHSHLIEQLLACITTIAKQLEKPMTELLHIYERADRHLGATSTFVPQPDELSPLSTGAPYGKPTSQATLKQLSLLAFICKQLPNMVELVAQIRGLAIHVIVNSGCDIHQDRKIRYLLQCVNDQNEKLRHQCDRISSIIDENISSIAKVKIFDIKLTLLLQTVEEDVLSRGAITTDKRQLFDLASQIIDVYLAVIDEGLQVLQRWQFQQLETWLSQ